MQHLDLIQPLHIPGHLILPMGALHLLSYAAGAGAFVFVLLSLASGLLYVADIIEEQSATAKVIGKRMIYVIILLLVVLHFTDKIPLYLTGLLIFSHLVYLQNFGPRWPVISLTSPFFILSCCLVLASHFASFRYFSERGRRSPYGRYRARNNDDTFLDVATFFGVCVWLIPFFLFLSLSANDNVLPSASRGKQSGQAPQLSPTSARHQRHQSSLIKTFLSRSLSMLPISAGRSRTEGIIAPPSPTASKPSSPAWEGSSLHSPTGQQPPRLQMPPRRPSDLPRRPSQLSPHQRSASGSFTMPSPPRASPNGLGYPSPNSATTRSNYFDQQREASPSLGDEYSKARAQHWRDLQTSSSSQQQVYKRK